MAENYTVYKHISPNGKQYVGITKQDVVKRWANGEGYKNCTYFYNAIQKYGWENFQHIILSILIPRVSFPSPQYACSGEVSSSSLVIYKK